jgi:multidrug resistance efflux pump
VSARNKFLILLSVVCAASLIYYLISTPHSQDLVLIGTVDSNQVIVSPQVQGRLAKLLIDEGTQVKQGDLIAVIDPSELEAQARAAAAMIDSLRSQVAATQATQQATAGSTTSTVANAQAKLQSVRAQLIQTEAMLVRTESDSRRTIELAKQGVASDQDRVQAESNLKAQQATVQALKDQVSAAQADLNTAIANTHQAHAAQSTVESTRGQLANAVAQLKEAKVRLGYTKIYSPITGTVSVRAAREGEVLNAGQPIATIIDLSDTWVRAAIPETQADHIGLGDTLRVRLPGGTVTSGKVFFKSAEADFATQRDVSRRKRDIKTIVLKVRLENPKGAYVPGMTAEVLVSPAQLKTTAAGESATAEQKP